eukprot:TRINITY_DN9447_c0_g2_i1.p1 TRINITY_DN9447_c0_g2~~TRINITY_DN9447_c0_g2_i1.p1  ORF type:complete len:235 (+),score=27.45 TRINITY_DN9447_c0_g2_i1:60-707(+)
MAHSTTESIITALQQARAPLTKDELVQLLQESNGPAQQSIMANINFLEKQGRVNRRWVGPLKTNMYWLSSKKVVIVHVTVSFAQFLTAGTLNKQVRKRRASATYPTVAAFKTPKSAKTLRKPFSTPRRHVAAGPQPDAASLEEERAKLVQEVAELKKEAEHLSEKFDQAELDEHIDNLHKYNEMKDLAQEVLGALAAQKGVTVQDMYQEYDIDWD